MAIRTITVADPMHPAGIERLRGRYEVALLPDLASQEAKIRALAEADAIVVRLFQVHNAMLDQAPKLRLVVKHGSGVDNIDVPAATSRGILVANTPGSNASAVAEGAVAMMLAVLRQTRAMDVCVRGGRFDERWQISLKELSGRTVGLAGFGQIGKQVARICIGGFNAKILCHDPFVGAAEMMDIGVEKVENMVELAARADILSIHVPLSAATRHLVGREVIAAMPSHAVLVNTSRGGTVDEAALIESLRQGNIAGAGIDVFEKEPPTPDNPLFGLENVVLSPHVAGVTDDGLKFTANSVVDVIDHVFSGQRPLTLLNGTIWENWKP